MEKLVVAAGSPRIVLGEERFAQLAQMPPELEWFASIESVHTQRAYRADVRDFMGFAGISDPLQFRQVNRAHVLAWRKELESRGLSAASVRRKLAALSSLYEFLCDRHAVAVNPIDGVKRPRVETYEGKTPALADHQVRALLDTPDLSTLKGLRDRAVLSVMLYHALRREEVTRLRVKDFNQMRSGVPHLVVHGKGSKLRFIPAHVDTLGCVSAYLDRAGHGQDLEGALFRAVRPGRGSAVQPLSAHGIYEHVVRKYLRQIGLSGDLLAPHALRATAATNALTHAADIAKVQEWLGHANIQTTRIYDRRHTQPQDSPTFRVRY